MYTRSPDYLYCRNGIYYFTRNVPSDLKSKFNKNRVVVSLHTRSISRAQKSAAALSDRLDRYFESLRLERFHSQELGLSLSPLVTPVITRPDATISEALNIYIRLKSIGRGSVFVATARRNISYLTECIGDLVLSEIKPTDAGKFRDHLIARGLSASSVKRVMASVKAIYNLGAKELGVTHPNLFTSVFIPDVGLASRPPPHSIERYNRQADHRQQAPRHDKIYHFVGLCRQIQLADLHPCIQPQQMNRDPHGVIDQQL
jgi:hypothetical protein